MHLNDYTDLILNNGKTAVFKGLDFWSRPIYDIEHAGTTYTVCCINLDGTDLNYYSPRNDTDGEPDYSLPPAFQPKGEPRPAYDIPSHTTVKQ